MAGPILAKFARDGPIWVPSRARKTTIPISSSSVATARLAGRRGRKRWVPRIPPMTTAQMMGKSTTAAGPSWNLTVPMSTETTATATDRAMTVVQCPRLI